MGMEISAFQARQQPRLTCPVCLQKPTSTLGEYCENHLTRCPIHHQLFVSRHVDKHYFRHLVKEDFVCLECFARGAPEGRAKERYRGLRDQFERVLWESGFWRYDDRNQEQSFWGALGGLLGGLM
jgi:hypothetical protein